MNPAGGESPCLNSSVLLSGLREVSMRSMAWKCAVTVARLYHEDMVKVDLETLELLCEYFDVDIARDCSLAR